MKRNYSPLLVTVWLTLTILFCWGQVTTSTESADSLIVEVPTNQTVPVNSTAIFSCKVTGILVWEIGGQDITSDRQNGFCRERGACVNDTLDNSPDETTQSVLLVTAIEENNNSMIRCLASESEFSEAEASNTVILKIFDRPEPPSNLLLSPESYLHLNLTWDAPFIFPGTEINYTVTIRNVNASEEIQREGLEVTQYIFSGTEGSSMCDVYQFSVVAVNSAGKSDSSENINSHLPSLPNIEASVESLKHDVTFKDGSAVASIMISFEPAGTCGGDLDAVTGYDITLDGDSTNVTVSESHDRDGRVNFEIANVEENFQYSFSIVAFNSVGNTTSEKSDIYTTDVQYASISMREDDIIVVTCSFARGSQAWGCQIRLSSPMETIALNISRLNASGIVIEPSYSLTCYDICALDWEADGTIGELCVPVTVNLSQFTSCGIPTEPDPEPSNSKSPILAVAVGGGVAVIIIVVVVVTIMSCRYKRKRKDKYHPRTECSNFQATNIPPVYDVIQNCSQQDDRNSDYSSLNRSTQVSPTDREEVKRDPQYSELNQVPTYAVLESNSIPLGVLPGHQEPYCEIEDLKVPRTSPINHESTVVPVSNTVSENEILYCQLPSAGTTV